MNPNGKYGRNTRQLEYKMKKVAVWQTVVARMKG